jgi:hypothetical protein
LHFRIGVSRIGVPARNNAAAQKNIASQKPTPALRLDPRAA